MIGDFLTVNPLAAKLFLNLHMAWRQFSTYIYLARNFFTFTAWQGLLFGTCISQIGKFSYLRFQHGQNRAKIEPK